MTSDDMTSDDYIHAAHKMEAAANRVLEEGHGHFKSYLADAMQGIAAAYYHADLANQRLMRTVFEKLFATVHTTGKVPGLDD